MELRKLKTDVEKLTKNQEFLSVVAVSKAQGLYIQVAW